MKQYKFNLVHEGNAEISLHISDGQAFVFSFPVSAYRRAKSIAISLYYNNTRTYRAIFHPPAGLAPERVCISDDSGQINHPLQLSRDANANIVVRIHKAFPASFKTYVNDRLVRASSIATVGNDTGRVDMAGVATDAVGGVVVTLNVFKYEENGVITPFAQEARVSNPSMFEIVTEDEDSPDGSGANPSSGANLRPRDADRMKYSSTMAWPISLELILSSGTCTSVQQRHDALMREWAIQRGNDISLNLYDYFIHSHGVAWPAALHENANTDKEARVLERHAQLVKDLP